MSDEVEEYSAIVKGKRARFPEGYKDAMFTLWYSKGKPSLQNFMRMMPPCEDLFNQKPSIGLMLLWLQDFRERAVALDTEVFSQINNKMVAEKVEMLQRHAVVGVEMQDMALSYLKKHKDDLGVSTSVRLLVAGIEVERESRGIATTIEKIAKMNDEELDKEIQSLLSHAPVEFLPMGEVEEDVDADN